MNVQSLLRAALAAGVITAMSPAGAVAGAYQIPWKGVPADQCAVLLEPASDGSRSTIEVILRCKGRIDVLLTYCMLGVRCTP